MNRSQTVQSLLIAVLVLLSLWGLYPTWRASQVDDQMLARAASDPALQAKIDGWKAKAIRKGLDLQGGMYLVLEVNTEGMSGAQASDALNRVVEILRNRVDQFGVSEPDIKPMGDNRIIVQLPGLQDAARAKSLIGSTARLEFRLVRPWEDAAFVATKLDEALKVAAGPAATAEPAAAADAAATQAAPSADEALDDLPALPSAQDASDSADGERPFTSRVIVDEQLAQYGGSYMFVPSESVDEVRRLLSGPAARVIPRDMELQFGMDERSPFGQPGVFLFLLDRTPSLTGDRLTTATSKPDPEKPGMFQVNFSLDRRGSRIFGETTGANEGRFLAISLDGKVKSAPQIITKITDSGSITGSFTSAQASDLALMLRAGALPVDVRIEEERTVGPSLGRDSIAQGLKAGWIGAVIVVVFMVVYYQAVGLVAVLALVVNMLIMMATLAQFGLVLTLPGIAGIFLTVGMAVDANVLINERIREELRRNKTARAAVDAGYQNATRTIVDSNVTTLIVGVVLLWFGTGPIKGFAVTLSIGILTSMFTALVLTRVILEAYTRNRANATLRI
ncbi:MAG: protein translocase subunit SecD [bacterium]|nr:protein translocase subunit SecD [bacterium]